MRKLLAMGQSLLIENRSGADGDTLPMVFDTHAANQHIFRWRRKS